MPIDIEKLRCGQCGNIGSIEMINAKGRSFPWKSYSSIKLVVDCEMPTCSLCSNIVLRGWAKDCERLDKALSQTEDIIKNQA